MNTTYEAYEVQYETADKKPLKIVAAASTPQFAIDKADWFVERHLQIADATQTGIRHITHVNVL